MNPQERLLLIPALAQDQLLN
jgi:hypothetical protein